MMALTTENTMLYCPKCQQTYDDGSQRFCSNDGGRLLAAPDLPKHNASSGGVFSNLLGKSQPPAGSDEKLASLPRFVRFEQANLPVYEVPLANRKDQDEPDIELELEPLSGKPVAVAAPEFSAPLELPEVETVETSPKFSASEDSKTLPEIPKPKSSEIFGKPIARIVRPSEIPSGTAEIGNRRTNPAGRIALDWDNPQALIGAAVKGRYSIAEQIEADDTSISYLADDRLVPNRKVVVRVLMGEDAADEFVKAVYAEERISLAHVDHPNIVKVIDSGELLEGKQFVVSEFIEADSVAGALKSGRQFNALRTARIVRQVAYALSEAHQNGILHRNLKPENLLLAVSEAGTEQVKLTNFGVSGASVGDIHYKSPEVLEGKLPTFAGDIYSLAVIAYQMLTGRLPFAGKNARELVKAQLKGLRLAPTDLRLDMPSAVDEILEKAFAYEPVERYPKARDFGDAFFNALTAAPVWEDAEIKSENAQTAAEKPKNELTLSPLALAKSGEILELGDIDSERTETLQAKGAAEAEDILPLIGDIHITPREEKTKEKTAENPAERNAEETAEKTVGEIAVQKTETKAIDPSWTRRSPEPPQTAGRNWWMFSFFGLAVLLLGLWAIWTYFLNRPQQTEIVAKSETTAAQTQPTIETVAPSANQGAVLTASDLEDTPPPRQIAEPANSAFFQNSRQNAKGDLLKNYLGFSLYYPRDWTLNQSVESEKAGTRGKFLEISRNAENGTPIEKMLVSYYESKGTYKADAENFPRLVKEANETLKKLLPNYQVLSEGEIRINGDWRAYEIKFQGGDKAANGEQLNLWGRRLFIPLARPNAPSGYEITMFATSLSKEVKSVDDVGVKGELGKILETFEPNRDF